MMRVDVKSKTLVLGDKLRLMPRKEDVGLVFGLPASGNWLGKEEARKSWMVIISSLNVLVLPSKAVV